MTHVELRSKLEAFVHDQMGPDCALAGLGCDVKMQREGQRHGPIRDHMALCLSNRLERSRQLLAGK